MCQQGGDDSAGGRAPRNQTHGRLGLVDGPGSGEEVWPLSFGSNKDRALECVGLGPSLSKAPSKRKKRAIGVVITGVKTHSRISTGHEDL